SRNAIEIRVMDVQECPRADVALAALIIETIRALYEGRFVPLPEQQQVSTKALAQVFLACVRDAERAVIEDPRYLRLFGMRQSVCDAGALWSHVAHRIEASGAQWNHLWAPMLELVCVRGTLARRLIRAAGREPSRSALRAVYEALCRALAAGELFEP
ncbi:MAG TPA: glutamate--cysteine ligase, partial [Burkholderiales bacterium]|nr:glutamate--cysteine ligase [Burkholderiales bacterium]